MSNDIEDIDHSYLHAPDTDTCSLIECVDITPSSTELNPEQYVGRGLRLTLGDGVEYLDAVSGTFNLALGYDHSEVVAAVADQLRRCTHMSSSYSAPYAKKVLTDLIVSAPANIQAGWMRDITGSTANECAIKIAQKATGRQGVLSFYLSHHGQTVFTTLASGQAFRHKSFPLEVRPSVNKVAPPYCYRCPYGKTYPGCGYVCAEKVHDVIVKEKPDEIACVILEPVFGNGGNIVPPHGFFAALAKICEETGVVLIADEVQTGMGRTGELYACDRFEIRANIITLAKGLGGIGIPIAAVLMEERLNILEQYEHSFTSGGNMLGLAAAAKTLEIIQQTVFLKRVRRNGALLEHMLKQLVERYDCVGEARGVGMMWGLEIVCPDGEPDVAKANAIIRCAERDFQLILRGSSYGFGNVIKVRPALVASEDDLVEIIFRLSSAIARVEGSGGHYASVGL